MAYNYEKPDVIVVQDFQNLHVTPAMERLQAVIVGPSYKKIKDEDESGSIFRRLDDKYRNEALEISMPDLPANSLVDANSIRVKIVNSNKELELGKSEFKGNVEGSAKLSNIEDQRVVINSDAEIEAEVGDVLTITSLRFAGSYEITDILLAEENKLNIVIDAEDIINETDAGFELSNVSFKVESKGYSYDAEESKISISPLLNIVGNVYLTAKALRRDYCDKIIMARASDLEEIFGKGEVNSENPLALGMQLALGAMGGGENAFVAGLMVESDDVLGYQKAFEVLEAYDVYAIVPLTNNLVIPQILREHALSMSKPEEKHERVGIFSSPWMNREIKAGQLMIQQDDGSYSFVKGQITTSGKPLDDNFSAIGKEFQFDDEEHVLQAAQGSKYARVMIELESFGGEDEPNFSIKINEESINQEQLSSLKEYKYLDLNAGDYTKVSFQKQDEAESEAKIHIYMYGDDSISDCIYHPIHAGMQEDNNFSEASRALRIKVMDSQDNEGSIIVDGEIPGRSFVVKCQDADDISVDKSMTISVGSKITRINIDGQQNLRYGIVLMELHDNGTLKVNRLVGGDMDPDVATFISSGVEPKDEIVIINPEEKDANTYSGYKEVRYRVLKAKTENEILIDKMWDEGDQKWVDRVFDAPQEEVYYRVESPVIEKKDELAKMYADLSSSFHERRITHIFAPYVGISEDNEEHEVPGYYFACAYAGATQGQDPQQGFTNMTFPGFTKVRMTNDYFTERQLNIIASGGTAIIVQENAASMLSCRHQLTTNMDTLEYKEYSITKIVDFCAKSARSSFRPYIGRYNVTDALIDLLYNVANSVIEAWKNKGVVKDGTTIRSITPDENNPDTVLACFELDVPYPLNRIILTLVV